MLELLSQPKLHCINPFLEASITIQRLFGFARRLWNVESSCLRFLLLSNLKIYSPKDYLNQGLNVSERNWWDGNSLMNRCLRGSVNGHFGYCSFYLNLSEQREYRQASIQPRLEMIFYVTQLHGLNLYVPSSKDSILHVEIEDFRSKDPESWLKILNTQSLFLDLFWYPFHPSHLGKKNSFLR